jgi:hypothetical protein
MRHCMPTDMYVFKHMVTAYSISLNILLYHKTFYGIIEFPKEPKSESGILGNEISSQVNKTSSHLAHLHCIKEKYPQFEP